MECGDETLREADQRFGRLLQHPSFGWKNRLTSLLISKEFHIELVDRAVALNRVNARHWCKSEVSKWLEGVLDPGDPALPDARNIWRNSVGGPLCTTILGLGG